MQIKNNERIPFSRSSTIHLNSITRKKNPHTHTQTQRESERDSKSRCVRLITTIISKERRCEQKTKAEISSKKMQSTHEKSVTIEDCIPNYNRLK